MTRVLSSLQLVQLKKHQYSAHNDSLVEPHMEVFWRWLVEQIPMSWAPNAITLTGFIINIITTLVIVYYSPDAKQDIPPWVNLLCAAGIFTYQTLDAIDGKQARRTKSSSPLGELFDHGCDACSTVYVATGTCVALQLGNEPNWMFFECLLAFFLYYAAHWQTYMTGTLKLGRIDVVEGQFTVIFVYIISALFGNNIWNYPLPLIGIKLKMVTMYFGIFAGILASQMYFTPLFSVILMDGVRGKTYSGKSVLSPAVPLIVVFGLVTWTFALSPKSFQQHPCLYLFTFGMAIAKITDKLIVAHMTKSEVDFLDSCYIGLGVLFCSQYFSISSGILVLWLCFFYLSADLLFYSVSVCKEICDHLGIFCFKISLTGESGKNKNSANNLSNNSVHGNCCLSNTRKVED